MRWYLPVAAALVSAACAAGRPSPVDLSNATLPVSPADPANVHAITEVAVSPAVNAVLAAPDRTPEDRGLDEHRQSGDVLTFLGVERGMRIAQLGAGAGYTTELLMRLVGPEGLVLGQNPPGLIARTGIERPWTERLARPVNAKVTRVDRNFESPLPPETRNLDLVYLALFYHDLSTLGVDRDAMNHAVHLALRSGGRFAVLDRTPLQGPFLTNLHRLHTEESRNVRREVEAAGFQFVSEGRFLRTSSDPRDWDASEASPTSEKEDRFLLVFLKPTP